jgi:predicted ATPase/class 3 adenylate cyclase
VSTAVPSAARDQFDRRLVAVMFTDMVDYTALLQADEHVALAKRELYWHALEHHHDACGGTIVQRLGDGSMSMFPSALAAVQAAVAIQRGLAEHDVQVRLGVHVGDVIVEPERLTGDAVNVAARIESFAVPGGVLLSDSAYEQIKNRSDIAAVALGRFRLKNVARAVELYAVSADGVVTPDPRTLDGKGERFARLPSNLPHPGPPLVGRADDLAAMTELVREHRVVTVTGPGGVGKTRFAIDVGRMLAPEFMDGVAFVPLAHVTEAEDFVPALAVALDVKMAEGRTLREGIVSLIGDMKALLLLDNLEQVVAAAPQVADLVERCAALRVVITSRTPLHIAAEREYALAPLALPPPSAAESPESLLDYPAVALLVERIRATRGSFELTPENATATVAVCRRLDGLPLALELAGARLRLLSPQALLERLDHALDVLASTRRDVSERQQTLRATIDWSHSLLTEAEQRLFRRLAAFAGGFTVDDVEAVCADPGEPVLDELESLVDKALVKADAQGDRLRMLETIREYARERLDAAGETGAFALRHAERYAALARQIRGGIESREQVRSIERGISEETNIEAALDTLAALAQAGDADACRIGLQLCGDLWLYWHIRGMHLTASKHCASFLGVDGGGAPTSERGCALVAAGTASWTLGRFERADDEWAEAHRIAAEVGSGRDVCVATFCRGLGLLMSDLEAARAAMTESIEGSRALGFVWAEGFALALLGLVEAAAGDEDAARASYTKGLDIQRQVGDAEGAGLSLGGLAQLAVLRGDHEGGLDLYRQSLASFEAIGDRAEEARILSEIAWTHLEVGDSALARRSFVESVQAYTDIGSVRGVGLSLVGLAAAQALGGRPERALQIAAAAERYASEEGIANVYSDAMPGRNAIAGARAALSPEEVARATEAGRRLTIDEALALGRAEDATSA